MGPLYPCRHGHGGHLCPAGRSNCTLDSLSIASSNNSQLLASPGFHHIVRRIHCGVHEARYGRDPSEPLRKGQATADPNRTSSGARGFLSHFVEELGHQARGRPTQASKDLTAKKK